MGLLRTANALRNRVQGDSGPAQLWVRQAKKDKQHVVAMRCFAAGGAYRIFCDVYPVDGFEVEPLQAGPYVFASEREAEKFADEATLVLEYLGCELVTTPGA